MNSNDPNPKPNWLAIAGLAGVAVTATAATMALVWFVDHKLHFSEKLVGLRDNFWNKTAQNRAHPNQSPAPTIAPPSPQASSLSPTRPSPSRIPALPPIKTISSTHAAHTAVSNGTMSLHNLTNKNHKTLLGSSLYKKLKILSPEHTKIIFKEIDKQLDSMQNGGKKIHAFSTTVASYTLFKDKNTDITVPGATTALCENGNFTTVTAAITPDNKVKTKTNFVKYENCAINGKDTQTLVLALYEGDAAAMLHEFSRNQIQTTH
jgi:hypothetical protein